MSVFSLFGNILNISKIVVKRKISYGFYVFKQNAGHGSCCAHLREYFNTNIVTIFKM